MRRPNLGTTVGRLLTLALGLLISAAQPTLTGTANADEPPPMPPFDTDSVAILGCSNTSHHSLGYRAQSSLDQLVYSDMGGLMFNKWGNPSDRDFGAAWTGYDAQRPESGYQAAWVMPCILGNDGFDSEALMTEVVDQIELRDGGIPIFVSPFSEYPAEHLCSPLGARGFDVGVALMEWSAVNLGTLYGPITGVVTVDLMKADGCHLNDAGITFVGSQLVDWFDSGGWQAGYEPTPDPASLPNIDPSAISAPIGVIGCANTIEHLLGYEEVSNADKFWATTTLSSYESGYLGTWANGDTSEPAISYWAEFSGNAATQPPTAVWLQICVARADNSALPSNLEQQVDLSYVIERINGDLVGVPIFVSARSPLVAGKCSQSGIYGDSNAAALVDWAVEHNLAHRGPTTGPIPASQLKSDGCSLTDEGMAAVGEQLAAFFDEPTSTAPDTTPPSAPVDLAATGVSAESVELGWSPSVDNVAVDHYLIERDGVELATSTTTSFTDSNVAPVTDYSYTVFAVDAAGNRSSPSNQLSVTTPDTDTSAPTVAVTAPADSATITGTVLVTVDAADNVAVDQVEILLDGTVVATLATVPYQYSLDTTTLMNGTHTLTAAATDTTGNTSTSPTITVTVDNPDDPPPTGQFTASTYTAAIGEIITFTDSHTGSHRRTLKLGNGTQASTRNNTYDYSYLVAGTYTVTLDTKDVDTEARTTLSLTIIIT